jgi:NAD(P)-dependent dehydrogenase (short-subunit alcohol dehydrogenase family)
MEVARSPGPDRRSPVSGKVCVITGATSGIGEATAIELARRGAQVVLLGRSEDRCRAAQERITASTGSRATRYLTADLASRSEVRRLADRLHRDLERIDVLINNAGALHSRRQVSPDGTELTFAVNVFAPFLLTELLLDRLRTDAPARIINVSSEAHRGARLDLDHLGAEDAYHGYRQYARSKLALLMLTYALSRRLQGSGVTANAVHPGFVSSGFGRNNPGLTGRGFAIAEALFGISPERGARTVVYAAEAPELEQRSGLFLARSRPRRSSARSYDLPTQERLWTIATDVTRSRPAAVDPARMPPSPWV